MKYKTVITLLGGYVEASERLGMSRHAISNWQVDKQGRLKGRRVRDAVVAALVRKLADERRARGEELDPLEAELIELP